MGERRKPSSPPRLPPGKPRRPRPREWARGESPRRRRDCLLESRGDQGRENGREEKALVAAETASWKAEETKAERMGERRKPSSPPRLPPGKPRRPRPREWA